MDRVEVPAGTLTFTALAAGPEDGRLVLLLHGFPETSHCWGPQLAALAGAGYRAVAVDQRGYSPGARPEGVDHYRVSHLLADVLAIADELGGHQVDLVGHDWGGAVAWNVAAHHPHRVRTLTSISMPHPAAFAAALLGDAEQVRKSGYIAVLREANSEATLLANDGAGLRAAFAMTGHPDPEHGTAEYLRAMQEPGALTGALNWYRALTLSDATRSLPNITVPTLFIWGEDDWALGRTAAEATAARVTGPYTFVPLAGIGHWIPEEVPDLVNRLLLDHLAAHP